MSAANTNMVVRRVAGDLLTGEYLRKGQTDAAIARAQENLAGHPNTESEKLALFDLFNIYFVDRRDAPAALAYLTQLENRYPNDELTRQARLLSGSAGAGIAMAKSRYAPTTTNIQTALPEHFELRQNYPNPFNPSTSIEIVLPIDSPIRLEVYDIAGRKVRTLISKHLPNGTHQVIWDGRNESGQAVGSGVYLYRLNAGDFLQTRKMILMR